MAKVIPSGKIRSALRRLWLYSQERREALKLAKHGKLYKCAKCGKLRRKVNVDHIEPVGKFMDWNTYVNKLFVPANNLQILCIVCHQRKTNEK